MISKVFLFDPELLHSKVYQRQMKSFFKSAIRISKGVKYRADDIRSDQNENNQRFGRRVLLEGSICGKLALIAMLETMNNCDWSKEEVQLFREEIRSRIVESMLSFVRDSSWPLEPHTRAGYLRMLRSYESAKYHHREQTVLKTIETL